MEVDLGRGVLVVEELGRRGLPIRHEVRVEADTPVVAASRLRLGDMRGQSAFGEMAVSLVDVLVGDFVVVEGEDLDGQTLARRVTIVETAAPEGRAGERAVPCSSAPLDGPSRAGEAVDHGGSREGGQAHGDREVVTLGARGARGSRPGAPRDPPVDAGPSGRRTANWRLSP